MMPLGPPPNGPRSYNANRILVIFPGALGDLLCLGPSIRALGRSNPGASIELMARMELARFAVGRMGISRAYSIDQREVALLFAENSGGSEPKQFFGQFRRILSFFAADDDRFRGALGDASGEGVASFHAFRPDAPGHVAAAYLDEIGEPGASLESHLEVLPEDIEAASAVLAGAGLRDRRVVILFPGSGGPHKNWPAENFVLLASSIRARAYPLFVLGPAEQELRPTLLPLLDELGIPHLSGLSLEALAGLARLAAGFIGNDSGVSHLAAACGAPGIVMFGPTDPARWRPLGRVEVVRAQSLKNLIPTEVISAVSTLIGL